MMVRCSDHPQAASGGFLGWSRGTRCTTILSRHFFDWRRHCLFCEGGLNRSMQHFILEGKDGVWDGTEISQRVYCGREDGVMGSLEARGVAKGDRAGFWQAVIVDLFSGGSAWWDSSRGSSPLQVGIDACGTRGDFQRCYGTSIGPVDRQTAWPLTLDGEPGNASQWRL